MKKKKGALGLSSSSKSIKKRRFRAGKRSKVLSEAKNGEAKKEGVAEEKPKV